MQIVDRGGLLVKRFEREARVTAGLRSPNTVQLYDYGVTKDGAIYYVMELLDGIDLSSLVKQGGPVPAERAIWFLEGACRSLAEAHDAGLVHRDIKPANLMACRLGHDLDHVKVLDFGVVRSAPAFGARWSERRCCRSSCSSRFTRRARAPRP